MEYSLSKIAKELGISKASVSLILNGKAKENHISAELERQVLDFCKKVNYIPNIHAQRVNKKYVKSVGLLLDQNIAKNNINPFADEIACGITGGVVTSASKKDYKVTIELYNENFTDDKIFNWLRSKEIDGLIYYGMELRENLYKTLIEENRTVVGIGIRPVAGICSVNIDNENVMYSVTKSAILKGKKKFLYVNGTDCYISSERFNGFKKAMDENNIDDYIVINCDFTEELAEKSILEIFKTKNKFDAIICANDYMAIGAIKALKKLKISVPCEVAVSGADNTKIARYFVPTITTVDSMNERLGKTAFELFYNSIKKNETTDKIIKSKVNYRDSL